MTLLPKCPPGPGQTGGRGQWRAPLAESGCRNWKYRQHDPAGSSSAGRCFVRQKLSGRDCRIGAFRRRGKAAAAGPWFHQGPGIPG